MREVAALLCMLAALPGHVAHAQSASSASQSRAADLAAIEKLRQREIAATVARDPVALTSIWTDDAVRFAPGVPAEIGIAAIRESNERQTANKSVKVLRFEPETKDFTFLEDGWAVELRTFTGSVMVTPGEEPKQMRGAALVVLKRLPAGSWKVFRAMGAPEPPTKR